MNEEIRREWRFYVCTILGAGLIFAGFFAPPLGIISNSVLVGSGMFLVLGGLSVGLDIKGVIHEYRLLKKEIFEEAEALGKEAEQ